MSPLGAAQSHRLHLHISVLCADGTGLRGQNNMGAVNVLTLMYRQGFQGISSACAGLSSSRPFWRHVLRFASNSTLREFSETLQQYDGREATSRRAAGCPGTGTGLGVMCSAGQPGSAHPAAGFSKGKDSRVHDVCCCYMMRRLSQSERALAMHMLK